MGGRGGVQRGKEEEDLAISGNSPFREETINISCLATHTHFPLYTEQEGQKGEKKANLTLYEFNRRNKKASKYKK